MDQLTRICSKCGKEKESNSFVKKRAQCLECRRKYNNNFYYEHKERQNRLSSERYKRLKKEDPNYVRRCSLQSRFKISMERYDALFEQQLGKCKICGTHQENLPEILHVDHCHVTGKVRGLLCRSCNSGIGFLKDDEKIVSKALLYLRESL